MRGSYILLATFFVTLFFCEAPGLANVVVQQKQSDSTREIAEQMTENLRRLPQQLSKALAGQSAQKAKEESDQTSLQASGSKAVPQSSRQQSSSGQNSQETGQDQGDRPKLRLPDDKPLGAAGPNRNRKPSPEEDADFIIIKDRWRIGVPEDPRFRKGSIFDPYHQNVLKGDYPIIGNDIFMNLNFASETFFNFRQLPTCQAKAPTHLAVPSFSAAGGRSSPMKASSSRSTCSKATPRSNRSIGVQGHRRRQRQFPAGAQNGIVSADVARANRASTVSTR